MSIQIAQQQKHLTYSELTEKAKKEAERLQERRENGFMALRQNVRKKLRELFLIVKPTEYFVAELICDATVDWKNQYKDISLEMLCKQAGIRMDVLKLALKTLSKMNVIKRMVHPTLKNTETMCLNPEYFGQILINSQKTKDKSHLKRHLKIVENPPVGNPNPESRNHVTPTVKDVDPTMKYVTPDKNHGFRDMNSEQNQKPTNLLDPFPRSPSHIPFPDSEKQGSETNENGERFTPLREQKRINNELKIKWLKETNGNIPFDEWSSRAI